MGLGFDGLHQRHDRVLAKSQRIEIEREHVLRVDAEPLLFEELGFFDWG